MILLRNLGRIYMEASKYNSREAIRLLEEVPDHHGKSSWGLALRGKCHFELAEYKEAADLFRILRDQDPLRLEMMEYYSTALWHLQVDFFSRVSLILREVCGFTSFYTET